MTRDTMIQHSAWLQTATGRAFDLLRPRPEMVEFSIDIAESLARIPRFSGHIRSGPYSVAQHCVIGADWLWQETGDATLAAHFLLHDAHEAYIGDIATPIQAALSIDIDEKTPERPRLVHDHNAVGRLRLLRSAIDGAIFAAAGLEWPWPDQKAILKTIDLRMLALERAQLLGPSPQKWGPQVECAEPLPMRGGLKIWPWPKAADEYRKRLKWLPAFRHLSTAA